MKKSASVLVLLLVLSFVMVSLPQINSVKAQYTSDGQAFILVSPISIISPSNSTYTPQSLTLNFKVKSFLDSSKANITIVYSIDGKDNKTIGTQSTPVPMGIQSYYLITGWATLPEIPEGSHSITVYGKYEFPGSYHNIGLDDSTVYFTISTNSEPSGNWSEVIRFTEEDKFFQTDPFTINHNEWRIRWEYEPDPEVPEEHPAFYVYVYSQESPGTYFKTILKKGINETNGTLYIHNRNGTFFLIVIRAVISFTVIIEQDVNSIPEFPSWTPLLIMLLAVMVVAVIYKRKLHESNCKRDIF